MTCATCDSVLSDSVLSGVKFCKQQPLQQGLLLCVMPALHQTYILYVLQQRCHLKQATLPPEGSCRLASYNAGPALGWCTLYSQMFLPGKFGLCSAARTYMQQHPPYALSV